MSIFLLLVVIALFCGVLSIPFPSWHLLSVGVILLSVALLMGGR